MFSDLWLAAHIEEWDSQKLIEKKKKLIGSPNDETFSL